MSKVTTRNSSEKVSRPSGYIQRRQTGGQGWLEGYATTIHGFVQVYAQASTSKSGQRWNSTHLEFIYKGRRYRRSYDAFYGSRRLITLGNRFARDVVKEVGN